MINPEKKDIHKYKALYISALQILEYDNDINQQNKKLIQEFLRDCRLGKTLRNRQKKSIGEARCLKYLYILRRLSRWFNKPFDKIIQKDMEKFIEDFENDKYKYELIGKNGKVIKTKVLSHSTKVDYKKTIRKFYKWLLGDNKHFPDIVDWIDTYDEIKEISALKREEVEKLADACNLRDKTIIMFLFDSGVRAEEFLNIKINDLSRNEDTYKVRIAYSKTKPRTIHLPIASRYVDMWLEQSDIKVNQVYLFPITYEALRMMLHRLGKRILKNKVYPHLFRHSSATFYANLLNHQQLCYRYGWTMASKMPNRYLDREGIFEEETPNVVKTYDISNLEKNNRNLSEQISLVRQENEVLSNQLKQINEKYDRIFQGKDFMKILYSLALKQEKVAKEIKGFSNTKYDEV